MKQHLLILLIAAGFSGCIDRYPDSAYMSTYLVAPGTDAQDTGSSGGQDAVVENDTISSQLDTLQDTPFVTCLKYNCPIPLAACGLNQGCIAILQCLNKCSATDSTCQAFCYPSAGANIPFENLYVCAASSCAP